MIARRIFVISICSIGFVGILLLIFFFQNPVLQKKKLQKNIYINPLGMKFVLIPKGSFNMGSVSNEARQDEKPIHQVTISKSFYLQTTAVTQSQWKAVTGLTINQQRDQANLILPIYGEGDDYPMYYVSWDDAQSFIHKLNELDPGKDYRLPTEAEWEYACRAGSIGERYGDLDSIAWYDKNSDFQTHLVGQKKPNAWGLYDMLGNVLQWCNDFYEENYYEQSPSIDPTGPASELCRVGRGSCWGLPAWHTRASCRSGMLPSRRLASTGFRLALDASAPVGIKQAIPQG